MYIQGYIYIYMQNCNQYENCDWNPRHRRSTMRMRIQGRFWCLLVISFFEVIYERKNFALLQDQSYLFAQGKTAKCNHNCKSGKKPDGCWKSYRRQTFKGFQKDSHVWAAWAKGMSWSSAGVSACAASLSPTTFVCCLITEKCLVTGSVGGRKLRKDLIDKKVWTWTWATHAVISHAVIQCC